MNAEIDRLRSELKNAHDALERRAQELDQLRRENARLTANLEAAMGELRLLRVCAKSEADCDHTCHCGTEQEPHKVGEGRCVRRIVPAPEKLENDRWRVDGCVISGTTLREQRGYYRHPCGCWSRWPGSTNSIKA